MSYYDEIIDNPIVIEFINKNYPAANKYQIAAFKNSVAYGVTHASGGYGGPSMREHLACKYLAGQELPLEEVLEIAGKYCFGEITLEHAEMLESQYCFDDDPEDTNKARQILESLQ